MRAAMTPAAAARLVFTSTWLIGDCIGRTRQRELRATVEAEPPKPQDEDAQSYGWDVGRRRGLDAAVGAKFSKPRPDDQHTGERGPTSGRMDDGRSGEILKPHGTEPATAPSPSPDDGINNCRQHGCKGKKRPQLHPLGQRTRYNRSRRRHKDHLKKPVRHGGLTSLCHVCGGRCLTGQQLEFIARRPV